MFENVIVRAEKNYRIDGYNLHILKDDGIKHYYAKDIVFEEFEDETSFITPQIALPSRYAQELFDDLWNSGMRATVNKKDGDTAVFAQTEHISDLRKYIDKLFEMIKG